MYSEIRSVAETMTPMPIQESRISTGYSARMAPIFSRKRGAMTREIAAAIYTRILAKLPNASLTRRPSKAEASVPLAIKANTKAAAATSAPTDKMLIRRPACSRHAASNNSASAEKLSISSGRTNEREAFSSIINGSPQPCFFPDHAQRGMAQLSGLLI